MQRRNTNQRQEVQEALVSLGHATSEQLIEYLSTKGSSVSLATIYRNLNILIDDGKVRKIKIGDFDVYETIKKRHYHFICKNCKNIFDIEPNLINIDNNSVKSLNGAVVHDYDMVFYGICHDCEQAINKN